MPQEYFFNGHLRWTFFWENPNCFAAFLSCLMAWVWCGQFACLKRVNRVPVKIAVILLYVMEAGIWFLLVKTYSRGGLVTIVFVVIAFFLIHGKTRMSLSQCFKNIAVRMGLVLAMCFIFGFASRLAPSHVIQDRSVLNRMDLWKGALVMINDSPFHGWGYKLSGMAYQSWYQPLSHTTRPVGFVNSYLEVAVEQGSHVLFFAVVCATAMLFIAAKLRREGWVAAAGVSLAVWLVSNLWSSLWFYPGLWILPGVAMLCIMIAAFKIRRKLPGIMALSLVTGIVIWTLIAGAGHVLSHNAPFQASPTANGNAAIVARRGGREKSPKLNTELWVDSAVMGRYWGKTIRTILEDHPSGSFLVHAPWALPGNRLERPANKYVYSGFQATLAFNWSSDNKPIIILHPTVYPPATIPAGKRHSEIIVCLPAIDMTLVGLPWRIWAAKNGAKLVFSPQGGIIIDPKQNKEFWRTLLFNE